MKAIDRLEIYREMYYFEIERRDAINNGASISLAATGLIGSGVFYLLDGISLKPDGILEWIYIVSLCVSVLFLISSLVFLARAWWGYKYGYVSVPPQFELYYSNLEEYLGKKGEIDLLESEFVRGFIKRIGEVTTHNRQTNRRKSGMSSRSKSCLIVSAIALVVAAGPHYILQWTGQL